ncbi:MAG TPA: c-type cytochrome [Noviherbaspirillum sp.]|nr:c-type cytochrome [Noviherbaspirillum sp.]
MNTERLFSLRNYWLTGSVATLFAIAAVAILIGFVWVPSRQTGTSFAGLWDAICRAAGAPLGADQAAQPTPTAILSSNVTVTPQMMEDGDDLAIGRGGTLALRCTMCHGIRGMSPANTPNLAGHPAAAIYKQLRDYQSGHRQSAIMAPLVRALSDRDMRDLSAYYASLPRITAPNTLIEQLKAPAIVQVGAPMRNIAPCASCHGGSDTKTGSPVLDGAPEAYVITQLRAFASGNRRNDIHSQMRNIARHMTAAEINEVARYYASR